MLSYLLLLNDYYFNKQFMNNHSKQKKNKI